MINYSTMSCVDMHHYFGGSVLFYDNPALSKWEGYYITDESSKILLDSSELAGDEEEEIVLQNLAHTNFVGVSVCDLVAMDSPFLLSESALLGYYLLPTKEGSDRLIEIQCTAPRLRVKGFHPDRLSVTPALSYSKMPSKMKDILTRQLAGYYSCGHDHGWQCLSEAAVARLNKPLRPEDWRAKVIRLLSKPAQEVVLLDRYLAVIKDRKTQLGYLLAHGVFIGELALKGNTISVVIFEDDERESSMIGLLKHNIIERLNRSTK